MAEFENLRQNGSGLSEQAALVLPHLEATWEFWQGISLGQSLCCLDYLYIV